MNKVVKWEYVVTGAFVALLFIHSLLTNPLEFAITYRSSPDFVSAIIMIATSGICGLMVGRLLAVYWKKKKEPGLVEILIGIFLFLGLTILVQGVFSFIQLSPHQLNLVCTQSVFFFLATAGVMLAHFQFEVFGGGLREKHNLAWFIVVVIIALFLDLGIVKDTIFGSERWELGVVGTPAVVCLFYLFIKLAYSALKTVNKVEDPIIKRGFLLMGYGWGTLFFGFTFLIIGGFFDFETIIDPTLFLVLSIIIFGVVFAGTTLLYIGFTLPMKTSARP